MKSKVVLALVLVALLMSAVASVAQADHGFPLLYDVDLVVAYSNAVYVRQADSCSNACNVGGAGYRLHLGYGSTNLECMGNTTPRANLTETRWEPWTPVQGPEVGETACIFWCCQPFPALMRFSWEFRTVTDGWWPD